MNFYLLTSGVLLTLLILVHSILGEIIGIKPLLRTQNLPKAFGSEFLFKSTIRATWHIASVLGLAIAVVLIRLAEKQDFAESDLFILQILIANFILCGAVSAIVTKLKHPSWIGFFIIAGFIFFAIT